MRVLVTGGAGFIGSNLCRRLATISDIERIVALDDLSTGLAANLDPPVERVELLVGSILDEQALNAAAQGVDTIVHLAARPSVLRSLADPEASHVANATGTLRVLEVARRSDTHVIVASSSSVYGATPTLPRREDLPTRPMSPYAVSKLATEAYANAYRYSFGLPTLALRLFNVYGPHQTAGHAYAAVIPAFVNAALRGEAVRIDGDGRQTRDFTYVDSVTAVLADAVLRRVTHPDPVNLAFGTCTDLLTLLALLEAIVGHPIDRRHGPSRSGDVVHSQADAANLRALFPIIAPTPLEDGLAATVAWMRSLTKT